MLRFGHPWGKMLGRAFVSSFAMTIAMTASRTAAAAPCDVDPDVPTQIDNTDPCYELYGNDQYWRNEAAGIGGSLVWTHTTDSANPANYAMWPLQFQVAGTYLIEVNVVPGFSESTQAAYRIFHAGAEVESIVNQAAGDGWIPVGEYDFAAGGNQWMRLDDNTGEPGSTNTRLGYDAIRITPLEVEGGDTGGESSSTGGDGGTGDFPSTDGGSSDGPEPMGTTTGGDEDDGGDPGRDTVLPQDYGQDGEDQGCGCRQGAGGSRGALPWLALMIVPLVRRRRP